MAEAVGSARLPYHIRASPTRGAPMQLKGLPREPLGKRSRRLLREGKLPAIVYGHNTEPTPITLDRLEFQKVFIKSGRTHLVDLAIDGRMGKVLVREIQTHPRRLGPIHVDFYQVNLEEKIEVEVPVHLVGESGPVKQGDADILQPMHSIRVECLPSDIPESFEVDITALEEIEAELRVADITVPKGVTVLDDPEELVVKIVHKRELKVEEEVPAAEAAVPAEGEAGAEGEAPAAEEAAETEE
ncbi:MAG: 50S ribosomal protein L25 [Chloroflexi bacterium]|nr:MAG: 50S ribosomal protein L25 [Chloroflexota bacterium]